MKKRFVMLLLVAVFVTTPAELTALNEIRFAEKHGEKDKGFWDKIEAWWNPRGDSSLIVDPSPKVAEKKKTVVEAKAKREKKVEKIIGLPLSLPLNATAGKIINPGDEVFVEVYKDDDTFIGYLQSCGDHAADDKPHVCAYSPKRTVLIGAKWDDPASLGTASFNLAKTDTYACPCNHAGTITFMPDSDHAISEDDQAEWNLGEGPLEYDRRYFPITNKRWKQDLGWNPSDPPCGRDDDKYCMNLNDPRKVAFVIKSTSACTATKVLGEWRYKYTIAAATTETWKHATNKQHSTSKTEEWDQSVTISVEQGWTLKGAKGKATVSTTIGHKTAETYSSEWSTSTEQDFSVTFGEEDIGKGAWQFHFSPSDTCGNSEDTLTQEFAITEGAYRMPCCIPGYSMDAPSYTTCFSEETMVPGGVTVYGKQICKVQSNVEHQDK